MELCPDAESLAVHQHPDGITDTVDHAIIRIVEQTELEFDHVFIFGIESGYIDKSLKIADFVSLFEP